MTKSCSSITEALGLSPPETDIPIPFEHRTIYDGSVGMSGRCTFSGPAADVECRILDISNAGATLAVAAPDRLPDRFTLYVQPLNVALACTVRRRQDRHVEVGFAPFPEGVM